MGEKINFNDPRSRAAPPKAATPAEQMDLATLQAKYLQQQRDAEELRRLRQTPLPQAPKTASQLSNEAFLTARSSKLGADVGLTESKLSKLETSARRAIEEGAALVKHPGFSAAVGMPNPFKGGFGIGNIPGSPAGDFANTLRGVKKGAFMQAFENLRGSGAISEKEGDAATQAIANMETATSEGQFKTELQRFLNIVADGVQVARQQSRMGASPFTYEQLMAERQRRARAGAKGGK